MHQLTAAHVTHEACEKIGGIGTVLEGFITSPVYQQHVKRTILIGPYANHLESPARERLGPDGTVLYSTIDNIDELGLAGKFHPIEWAFNVAFIYGKRRFVLPGSESHTGEAEVLLIDVFNINKQHVNHFKSRLASVFNIDSLRYEADWGYEEYVRLAEPAFYALSSLLQQDELPCMLFSHEFMGLPTAFKATLDGQRQFRTVFHAHECATARHLVESHPGHDTAFYNILKQARQSKLYVNDVFGDRSHFFRHALISRAHVCDAIIAVGDHTAEEMHFLGRHFDHHHIDLVYNGVPPLSVTFDSKLESRRKLLDYSEALLGWRPQILMTHVTRPVVSKGIWRDIQVCEELDARFARANLRGVLYIVTSAGGTRRPQDIQNMVDEYGWPRRHREGYPDLVGPESGLSEMVDRFNTQHRNIQAVLVNQFGWSTDRVGAWIDQEMDFGDLRRAADIEFGMATYEPFGISPLEPLGAGAICIISSACGCRSFVAEVTGGKPHDNIIVADYAQLERQWSIEELLGMSLGQRDSIERRIAREIADAIVHRLPRSDSDRQHKLKSGQQLISSLGWDHVLDHKLIPMLQRVMMATQHKKNRAAAKPNALAV